MFYIAEWFQSLVEGHIHDIVHFHDLRKGKPPEVCFCPTDKRSILDHWLKLNI